MTMTAATIPTFSGADPAYPAARWVEDFSDTAEVFGWSPPQKVLIARRVLTGVAGLWLRTENKFKTFEELQRALLEEFPDKVDTKHIHELMTDLKKTDVSVKQVLDQRQSSGYRCQSKMSAKQTSIMFEVRMDEATNRCNDYSKEKEVTAIKNEYEKCQCQTEVVNNVNNKQVLQNKKEKSSKKVPIELESIKEEKIVEHKVEEVCETKIVEEQVEKVEEKVEKVVKKEHFSGEFPSLVKEKDGLTRRYIDNKKVYKRCVEKDRKYQDGLMENEICCKTNEENIKKKEIAKRVQESCNFSDRIMKDAMEKDYHILR